METPLIVHDAQIANELAEQVQNIRRKCKPFNSPHEMYGVLCEELQEFFEEVMLKREARSKEKMAKELLDLAAAACRAAAELRM